MPQYDIQDPVTGHQVTLEGDSPPTEQELEEIFRVVDAQKRPISSRPAIPEPGQPQLLAASPAQLSGVPQAFPATEAKMEANRAVPALSFSEAEQMLSTPWANLPREPFQAPGLTLLGKMLPGKAGEVVQGVNAGVANLGAGLVEQGLMTPAAGPMLLGAATPLVRVPVGLGLSALGARSAGEMLGEASVTKDPQDITEAVGMSAMALLGALATGVDIRRGPHVEYAREFAREQARQVPPRLPVAQQVGPQVTPGQPQFRPGPPETPTTGAPDAIPQRKTAPLPLEESPAPGAQVGQEVRQQAAPEVAPQEAVVAAPEAIVAAAETIAPQPRPPAKTAPGGRQRAWDIIDEIEGSIGKITTKKHAKPGSEGYYGEGYENARTGAGRKLFAAEGQSPDQIVDTLRKARIFPEEATVDDLWMAIDDAKRDRRAAASGGSPEAQAGRFAKALQQQFEKKRKQLASASDLNVGDRFKFKGEEMEVTAVDPETGDVTIKDGRKFGEQTVPDGAELPVDRGSFDAAPRTTAFTPDEFGLNVPETEGLTALRVAREKYLKTKKRRAARPPKEEAPAAEAPAAAPEATEPGLEAWADRVIRDRLRRANANIFLDPEFDAAVTVKAAMIFKRGVTDFARWSNEMRKEFGNQVTDAQLTMVYEQLKAPLAPRDIASDTFDPKQAITPTSQRVGASAGSALEITKTVQRLGQRFSELAHEWLWTRGEMPEWMHNLKKVMEGMKARDEFAIKASNRLLMDALAEHYQFRSLRVPGTRLRLDWEKAGGGSRRIPLAAVEAMDDYMKGRIANPTAIPPRIRAALDTMRAERTRMSGLVLEELERQRNRHPVGSAAWQSMQDLVDKVQGNLDVYIHRSYEFFEKRGRSVDEYYEDLDPNVRTAAEDAVMTNAPHLSREEATSFLRRWLHDLQAGFPGGPGSKLGSKDISILMRRNVISPEFRAMLGEHRSPLLNYTRSMTKMSDWLAKQQFLTDVRRRGLGTLFFEEGQDPPGFNKQLAAEGSDVMSPLNGLRTSEQMVRIFEELNKLPTENILARWYLYLNAATKWAAVVPSPLTQMRNLEGRPLMSVMPGHWDMRHMPEAIALTSMDFTGKAPERWTGHGPPPPGAAVLRQTLEDAREFGVLSEGGRSGELMNIMQDVPLQDLGPGEIYSWSALQAMKHYGYDLPTGFYRASDNLGSLFGWLNETQNQLEVHPNWTLRQARQEAARLTRLMYPYYPDTPKIIRAFSRLPIWGMFVTFPYQAKRTIVNTLRQGVTEMRSANPVEQRLGRRRMVGVITALSAPFAMQEASKLIVGITGEQEEDFRRHQAKWAKNSKQLFLNKDTDQAEVGAVNLSYSDPYSALTDTLIAALRSLKAGDPVSDAAWESFKELTDPYTSEQALFNSLREAYEGVTDEGRRIYNRTDPGNVKLWKQIDHVKKALWPAAYQRFQKRIWPAIKGEQPVFGRKLEPVPEILSEATGVRYEKHSYRTSLDFKSRDFRVDDVASEQVFHDAVSRVAQITPEEVVEAYKESDRRRLGIWKEMRKDFMAAVRGGVPLPEAQQILSGRGVTKRDAELIAVGIYKPNPISNSARENAARRGRTLPEAEISLYQLSVEGQPLDD